MHSGIARIVSFQRDSSCISGSFHVSDSSSASVDDGYWLSCSVSLSLVHFELWKFHFELRN